MSRRPPRRVKIEYAEHPRAVALRDAPAYCGIAYTSLLEFVKNG